MMRLKKSKKKFRRRIITVLVLICSLVFLPVLFRIGHSNSGESQSTGTVSHGGLVNGYQLPYRGSNFRFYSYLSYFPLGRCYVHQKVYQTLLDSYKILEKELPDHTFYMMECSGKSGGRMWPHKTHQNGLSVDFMSPLKNGEKVGSWMDHIGIWRYLMEFDKDGKSTWNPKVTLDFETMAHHLLALDRCARKNGLRVKKVILETNLKDEFFATKTGKKLKNRGIYFVRYLPPMINALHDDHYHVDFEVIR